VGGDSLIFPHGAIQGLAAQFADLYSQYLECPWEFLAFAFLTALGSMITGSVTLESEITIQPRLYTILLGESADDRKSTSLNKVTGLFESVFPTFIPCNGVGSAEGLAGWITGHPSTILKFDELKSFVSKANIESSILLTCVGSLFEENQFHNHTKGHSIAIDNGHLSILAASTIDTYDTMWNPQFKNIGFMNRLWLVPGRGERRFSTPKPIPQPSIDAIKAALQSLITSLQSTGGPLRLHLTPEGYRVFDRWYMGQGRSIHTKRLDTYGHRLMVLFAVNEGKGEVDEGIAERVVRLLEWQLRVRQTHDPLGAEGRVARMEENIRRALNGGGGKMKKRSLQQKVHYERDGLTVWNIAIDNLVKAKEIGLVNGWYELVKCEE
jgi:hypothetical protein